MTIFHLLAKFYSIPHRALCIRYREAVQWETMLEDWEFESPTEIAKREDETRAIIKQIQIMNLLKLPAEMQELLAGLDGPKGIRKYSERTLRNACNSF
jgi:hypothetical protein